MSSRIDDQPGKTILPHGDTDRILRCHFCGRKLATYDNSCLDAGAFFIEDPVTLKCKKCERGTNWRPSTPRRRP